MADYLKRAGRLAAARSIELEGRPSFVHSESIDVIRSHSYPMDRGLESYAKQLPTLLEFLRPGLKVLDIGAGNGIAAQQISVRYECEVECTGIVANPEAAVPLVVADATSLPFRADTFDLVMSVHAISWCPDQRSAIMEALRVTRPGGTVLLSFIRFSASVDIWFGDEFWSELGVDPTSQQPYDYSPQWEFRDCEAEIRVSEFPDRPYRERFFVQLGKMSTG